MKSAINIVLLAVTAFPVCILMHELTHLIFGLAFGTKIVKFCFWGGYQCFVASFMAEGRDAR